MVHTEVVLQGDGGKGLCGSLYLHVLLSLYGLVQTIAPAAAFHDTACLLVHSLHLTIDDHGFIVLIEHGVSLEQLLQGVHALTLDGVVVHQLVLLVQALLVRETLFCFQGRQLSGDIGQYEEFCIVDLLSQPGSTLVCEVARVQLLVNHEIQGLYGLGHLAVVVLHILLLSLQHAGLDTLF